MVGSAYNNLRIRQDGGAFRKTSVSQRVILIDGNRLGELMIEHNIGVTTAHTESVKRIDSDYFEDE